MKICFLGPANSAHMIKWCQWFSSHGHEVHLVSFTPGSISGTQIHLINIGVNPGGSDLEKLKYLSAGKQIRRLLKEIRPDVVNAHYATSYGTAMALSGIKGYALSVWGSDIYDFPRKSPIHKELLKFSLKKAGCLFSTSKAMADEAAKYTDRAFEITPFGVDLDLFNPNKRRNKTLDGSFTIGTVKGLSDKYGIRYILEAAAAVKRENDIPISVRIAGKGPQEQEYHQLAEDLGIKDNTTWLGFISQKQAAEEWAKMDIAIIPSILESFGVSAVEAQACGTPVIISDIPGLMEATKPGETSIAVPKKDEIAIAEAIRKLYSDPLLRKKMGFAGRQYVIEKYEINQCFKNIEKCLIWIAQQEKQTTKIE